MIFLHLSLGSVRLDAERAVLDKAAAGFHAPHQKQLVAESLSIPDATRSSLLIWHTWTGIIALAFKPHGWAIKTVPFSGSPSDPQLF